MVEQSHTSVISDSIKPQTTEISFKKNNALDGFSYKYQSCDELYKCCSVVLVSGLGSSCKVYDVHILLVGSPASLVCFMQNATLYSSDK